MTDVQIYTITPVPAPRMTKRDKWLMPRRPSVQRYFDFAERVRKCINELPQPCKVTFYIEMPKSWSKKKKAMMNGKPHLSKPDQGNLQKALEDAVYYKRDDSHIWSVWVEKRWSETPHIAIEQICKGL